ncbi:MAG: leucine-rich repeat domain-containing protein [Pseudomonadota bacterium]
MITIYQTSIRLICTLLCLIVAGGCETIKSHYAAPSTPPLGQPVYRLDLSGQNLTTLPAWLNSSDLSDLRALDLSGNPNLDLAVTLENICSRAASFNTLLVAENEMRELPGGLTHCSQLTHLSLAGNPQLDLAEALASLHHLPLKYLNLSNNNLTELPAQISQLKHLRDLRLSENKLASRVSFAHLGKLPALHSLWLDRNGLTSLPATINQLQQIKYLFLDHNNLRYLPREIAAMANLRVLHLTHNEFSELPPPLLELPRLLVLFAASNQIRVIDPRFKQASLKGIVLDNNPLSATQVHAARKLFRGFFLFSA